jgi:hypothetical protein
MEVAAKRDIGWVQLRISGLAALLLYPEAAHSLPSALSGVALLSICMEPGRVGGELSLVCGMVAACFSGCLP